VFFTSTVAKTVDTLRNLLNNDPSKLAQHVLVNERSVDDYVFKGWRWNEGRYGVQRSLRETVDVLNKVISRVHPTHPTSFISIAACSSRVKDMASIDNMMKSKLNNYNLVKGSLVQMQRKKTCVHASRYSLAPLSTFCTQWQSLRAVSCRCRVARRHDTGFRVHANMSRGGAKVRFCDSLVIFSART
jgi:hypothetical protein